MIELSAELLKAVQQNIERLKRINSAPRRAYVVLKDNKVVRRIAVKPSTDPQLIVERLGIDFDEIMPIRTAIRLGVV